MKIPFYQAGQFFGYLLHTSSSFFFFGSKVATQDQLQFLFPHLSFHSLKQVHGNKVISASRHPAEADGHFTTRPLEALMIQTADCAPVLLANRNEVCALHAGWRGVASNIVKVGMESMAQIPQIAIIGPHIGPKSFEVGQDVKDQLLNSVESLSVTPHRDPKKCFINLSQLLIAQIQAVSPQTQIVVLEEDTFSDTRYSSFRRSQTSQRQLSFVVLKD